MSVTRRIALSLVFALVISGTVGAAELSRYREFELGSSMAAVTAVTQTTARDLKTIHSRPALLQDVVWQPRYMAGTPIANRNSINEIVFSFVNDRLFRMTVTYDRTRTTGLTDADMIAALAELYGTPNGVAAQSKATAVDAGAAALAEWQQAETQVILQRSRYGDSFSLVITSLPLEVIARKARAEALVLDTQEAPAREAALAKKRADDRHQEEERTRTANKKVFTP